MVREREDDVERKGKESNILKHAGRGVQSLREGRLSERLLGSLLCGA